MNRIYEDIGNAKTILQSSREILDFVGFNPTYLYTNENMAKYLNLVDMSQMNSALAVLSSGDGAFNLVSKGIKDIDTFDVNKFTEYFALGLKRALIQKSSYQDFFKNIGALFSENRHLVYETINDSLSLMDKKYRVFWRAINDYLYKQEEFFPIVAPLRNFFRPDSADTTSIKQYNNYLQNAEVYEEFKSNLSQANIRFQVANATDLSGFSPKKYDLILLSNILDYFFREFGAAWEYDKLKEFEQSLETLLNEQGIIFLHYLFAYKEGSRLFKGSWIYEEDLQDEEIYRLENIYKHYQYDNGMILKRAKGCITKENVNERFRK